MYARVLAAVTAAVSLIAGSASAAAVLLNTPAGFACEANICSGLQTIGGGSPLKFDTLTLNRALLGGLANQLVRITFWTKDGRQVGDLGDFALYVLGGDELTLKGREISFDPADGEITFRIEKLDFSGGGAGGGGGGFSSFGAGAAASNAGGVPGGFTPPGQGGDPPGLDGSTPALLGDSPGLTKKLLSDGAGFGDGTPAGGSNVVNFAALAPIIIVPEPGAWALMLLGFGGIGAMARARRAKALRA